ncbi:prolyl 4-hydroxylase subunit alpha-1-like [Elysia marginata]|uniref:Prolyl 4-hydroxylase subunit alpha-1-like n=1 Tax=Elysia marginata TaxID=1093978 RepID=A0AAV4G2T4_9GAST|nr:prolyl 4-hydroxylase subunit alpha-1-like [Elysia marginata]
MARKRTPTNEVNGQNRQSKGNTSRLPGKTSFDKPPLQIPPTSLSRVPHALLTSATILITIITAVVCYSIYPELTSFSSLTRRSVPSLRQIINSEENSHLPKLSASEGLISNAFQPNRDREISQVLGETANLVEASDEEVAKLAAKIMEIKSQKIEESGNVKLPDEVENQNIAQLEPRVSSGDLKSREKTPVDLSYQDTSSQELMLDNDILNNEVNSNKAIGENQDEDMTSRGAVKNGDLKVEKTPEHNKVADNVDVPFQEGSNTEPIVLSAEKSHISIDFNKVRSDSNSQKRHVYVSNDIKDYETVNSKEEKIYTVNKKSEKVSKKKNRSMPEDNASRVKSSGTTTSKSQDKKVIKMKNKNENKRSTLKVVKSEENSISQSESKSSDSEYEPSFLRTFTPKKTFYGGRRIAPMELLNQKPSNSSVKVFLFDDFLSQQECEGLMRAHNSHVEAYTKPPILCFDSINTLRKHVRDAGKKVKVTPQVFTEGTSCVNASFSLQLQSWLNSNWSYSTAFYPGESKFSTNVAARLHQAMGLKPENGGKFQITSYPLGKAYKTHTDCTPGGRDKRDRVISVLMYLNDAEEGGETKFPGK